MTPTRKPLALIAVFVALACEQTQSPPIVSNNEAKDQTLEPPSAPEGKGEAPGEAGLTGAVAAEHDVEYAAGEVATDRVEIHPVQACPNRPLSSQMLRGLPSATESARLTRGRNQSASKEHS